MRNGFWISSHRGQVARILPVLYAKALCHFGPQRWWPGDTREEVILGAVLTQNTAWTNVERALENLRGEIPLTLRPVAEMDPERLARAIRPAGYFTLKTRRLQSVAGWFVGRCGPVGRAKRGRADGAGARSVGRSGGRDKAGAPAARLPATGKRLVARDGARTCASRSEDNENSIRCVDSAGEMAPGDPVIPAARRFSEDGLSVNLTPLIGLKGAALEALRQEILEVHGVGPETADSILLYALDGETFVVDAYTMRIGERHGLFPPGTSYEEAKLVFEGVLGRNLAWFNEYHAQIVALGKTYCRTRNPLCAECPLGAEECFIGGRSLKTASAERRRT